MTTQPSPKITQPPSTTLGKIPKQYQRYKHLFIEKQGTKALPKHQPWDYEIKLKKEAILPFSPIYSMNVKQLETLKEYIDDALRKGIIRESKLSAASPVLWAPKAGNPVGRLCVDYRKLNELTIMDRYPLPLAHKLQDRLHGATIFTKLDLRAAFNLIRIKASDEWKTAFRSRFGLYEYLVMPFGLYTALQTC